MTAKKGAKPPRDKLVDRMNAAAHALLSEAEPKSTDGPNADKVSIGLRLDLFKSVASWIAVRNKLDDPGADKQGAGLDEYRKRLAESSDSQRETQRAGNSLGGKLQAIARHGTQYPDGDGGPALDRIRSRIPPPVSSLDVGDSRTPGGEVHPPRGSVGRIPVGDVGGPGAVDK